MTSKNWLVMGVPVSVGRRAAGAVQGSEPKAVIEMISRKQIKLCAAAALAALCLFAVS